MTFLAFLWLVTRSSAFASSLACYLFSSNFTLPLNSDLKWFYLLAFVSLAGILSGQFSLSLSISWIFPFYRLSVMFLRHFIKALYLCWLNSDICLMSWNDLSSLFSNMIFWQIPLNLKNFWYKVDALRPTWLIVIKMTSSTLKQALLRKVFILSLAMTCWGCFCRSVRCSYWCCSDLDVWD